MTNSIPTRFNISRRGIDIESLACVNCDVGIESTNHLFFACDMAKKISKLIARWWDVPFMDFDSYGEWRSWIDNVKMPKKNKNMFEVRMTKVIKREFEKIKDVKVEDVLLTCDTSLEVFNNEVNQLSGMDNDLFTYEIEVVNILCDSKIDDDSEHEADDDMGYDPSDVAFTKWLGSKFFNYKIMDHYTMKALWIYWIKGDDEVELTGEESSDDMDEVAETYLLRTLWDSRPRKITRMIRSMNGTRMYHGSMRSHGLTLDWKNDGYCNGGNLPGTYIIGNQLHYQDYEWYEALEDSELKYEALRNKAIMEGFIKEDNDESRYEQKNIYTNYDDA
ncbi:reverse transcriptase domain-containing protein [Tanacetum coccineum]